MRRLLRRSIGYVRIIRKLKDKKYVFKPNTLKPIAQEVIENYHKAYKELNKNKRFILEEIQKEEKRFSKTLERGFKEFQKIVRDEEVDNNIINGKEAFDLYQTYGFPLDMTEELANEQDIEVDKEGFQKEMKRHKELSREGAKKRFKGGLVDAKEETIKLHTAAHLMLAGLKKFLGKEVIQRGANINTERLRFDFSYSQKLTEEEKKKVEDYVNEAISKKITVNMKEITLKEAKRKGFYGTFDDKYGDKVKVYLIKGYSNEICGGPHVKNTGEIGKFKIIKEGSSSAGVRRIKAVIN
ncbi:MAG: hypothetical protein JRF56_10495 [Deltaproteobacteria bacterium]|nr:hypothetical protein [Deltaproteobacteria bacterium]